MKTFLITLIASLALLSCVDKNNAPFKLEDGVSLELANYRKGQISDINYQLDFNIPKDRTSPIPAKLVLSLDISNLEAPLYLDFKEQTANL